MKNSLRKIISGISLLELLICLAILALIYLVASPSLTQLSAQLEYRNLFSAFQQQIHAARNQALISNQDVVICSSSDMLNCKKQQWAIGLIVYIDLNKDRQRNNNEIIISHLNPEIKYGSLIWYGNASHPDQIVFQSDTGLPRGSNGRFRYCNFYNTHLNLDLQLSQMGHFRSTPTTACESVKTLY
ncbi:GspH/FimT family protein [Acinetobacter rudis]|uniref:GspH/FimT family protein n=1 Tax=Acinetobacter rudis TaxID=632955 RepID=UPI003340BC5D